MPARSSSARRSTSCSRAAASLHRRPARLDPAARPPRRASRHHRGHGAEHDGAAARLPLRRALPVRAATACIAAPPPMVESGRATGRAASRRRWRGWCRDGGRCSRSKDWSKHFVAAPLAVRAADRARQGRRRRQLHGRGRQDAGAGRRIRLRQIHRQPAGAAADRAGCGQHPLRGPRSARVGRERAARVPPRCADHLPGPLCLAQSAHDGQPDPAEPLALHDLVPPARRRERVEELLRLVGLEPRFARALSARILRRPAPAHRDRPGAGGRAETDHLRRAGLGARRLDPLADPQPAARPAGPAWPRLHLRLARPRGGQAHRRPRRRDESRRDRRDRGRPRRCSPRPAIPTAGRCCRRSRCRSRGPSAAASCCRARCRARSIRRPAAAFIPAAPM